MRAAAFLTVALVAGCAEVFSPSAVESVPVPAGMTNEMLTERVVASLAQVDRIGCSVFRPTGRARTQPPCPSPWWPADDVSTDPAKGVITAGPVGRSNVAGHRLVIKRVGRSMRIKVAGAGIYYIRLPNAEVAQSIAARLDRDLNQEAAQ